MADTTTAAAQIKRYCKQTGHMCEFATDFGYCQLTACSALADLHREKSVGMQRSAKQSERGTEFAWIGKDSMERLTTKRADGRWALVRHKGERPLDNIPRAIDRLAAYEDAEGRGELIWVRKDSVIRRALEDYVKNLNWDLGERLAHGETIEGLKSEIKIAMDALGEIDGEDSEF